METLSVFHSVMLKLIAPTKESFAALLSQPVSVTSIQEWILIEDVFNVFFLPAAFEDDAIAVPVSAAAAASHYWYVLMSARLSADKLINVDASQYHCGVLWVIHVPQRWLPRRYCGSRIFAPKDNFTKDISPFSGQIKPLHSPDGL